MRTPIRWFWVVSVLLVVSLAWHAPLGQTGGVGLTQYLPILKNHVLPARQGIFDNLGPAIRSNSAFAGFFSVYAGERVFYGTTRSGEYGRMFRYNVESNLVDLIVPLIDAGGAWALYEDQGFLYVGTYYPAILYRYDLAENQLVQLAVLGNEQFVWAMRPAGRWLYLGTSPGARVYRYGLDSGVLEDLGAFSTEDYVRSIETYGDKVYLGIGAQAALIEYDPTTGATTDILPPEFANDTYVYHQVRLGTKLFFAVTPSARIVMFDLETRQFTQVLDDAVHYAGNLNPAFDDNNLHFLGLHSYLFEYDPQTVSLTRLLPYGSYQMSLVGGEIVNQSYIAGVTADAYYYEVDFSGEVRKEVNLAAVGLEPLQAQLMSLAAGDGRVVTGERQLRLFDPASGQETYRLIPGEPKVMCFSAGELYVAYYPIAQLFRYSASVLADPESYDFRSEVFRLLDVDDEQTRPRALVCQPDFAVFSTEPMPGRYGGVLAYYSADGESYQVRNLVPNHTILAIEIERSGADRYAYLGSSAIGGLGTTPLSEDAHLVKYDLVRRSVVWDVIPKPANRHIQYIHFRAGKVFALMDNGSIFVIDPATGQTLDKKNFVGLKKTLLSLDGYLYGLDGASLLRIDPDTLQAEALYNDTFRLMLAEDQQTGDLYFMDELDLLRYR